MGLFSGSKKSSATNTKYTNFSAKGFTVATSQSSAKGGVLSFPWYVWVIAGVVAYQYIEKRL